MVGKFFCYYRQKSHKQPSSSLTIEGAVSICDISWKEVGSDLHMEVGIGGICCVYAEGGRSSG